MGILHNPGGSKLANPPWTPFRPYLNLHDQNNGTVPMLKWGEMFYWKNATNGGREQRDRHLPNETVEIIL